jgi:hypothetical protein
MDAAQAVLDAILAGRLTVYSGRYTPADPLNGSQELARLMEPLGQHGVGMLVGLYHALPDGPAGDVLAAIRKLKPDTVRAEAQKRFDERLAASCVDQDALKALLREGQREFPGIEASLLKRGCRKEELVWPKGDGNGSQPIQPLEEFVNDPVCRQAIKDIFWPNF